MSAPSASVAAVAPVGQDAEARRAVVLCPANDGGNEAGSGNGTSQAMLVRRSAAPARGYSRRCRRRRRYRRIRPGRRGPAHRGLGLPRSGRAEATTSGLAAAGLAPGAARRPGKRPPRAWAPRGWPPQAWPPGSAAGRLRLHLSRLVTQGFAAGLLSVATGSLPPGPARAAARAPAAGRHRSAGASTCAAARRRHRAACRRSAGPRRPAAPGAQHRSRLRGRCQFARPAGRPAPRAVGHWPTARRASGVTLNTYQNRGSPPVVVLRKST